MKRGMFAAALPRRLGAAPHVQCSGFPLLMRWEMLVGLVVLCIDGCCAEMWACSIGSIESQSKNLFIFSAEVSRDVVKACTSR